jgi:hypothetical protein
MLYYTDDYSVSMLCVSFGTEETRRFGNWICYRPRVTGEAGHSVRPNSGGASLLFHLRTECYWDCCGLPETRMVHRTKHLPL